MSLAPPPKTDQTTLASVDLKPAASTDSPTIWRQFIDALRTAIGLKPIHLAQRYAEAKIETIEVTSQAAILRARQDYEEVMALISLRVRDGEANRAKVMAEARKLRAEARQDEAKARILELAARHLEDRSLSPGQAWEQVRSVLEKIESAYGGRAELQLPPPTNGRQGREGSP